MFKFIENYRRGKAYDKAWRECSMMLGAFFIAKYEANGKMHGCAVWDGLLGEEADGDIRAYRLSHLDEINAEIERLMSSDLELRNIILATLLFKGLSHRFHGDVPRSERILGHKDFLKRWGYPSRIPKPDYYLGQALEYVTRNRPPRPYDTSKDEPIPF